MKAKKRPPPLGSYPEQGGNPQGKSGVFHFTLLFFFSSTSRWARSSPRVGFSIRGFETEGEKDFETGGLHDENRRRSQKRKSGMPRTERSGNIRLNELIIGTRGALNQLSLHLFVFRTETGLTLEGHGTKTMLEISYSL